MKNNRFLDIGINRTLTYSRVMPDNTSLFVLRGYYLGNSDANLPWPGELIPPYMGEPMPNEYFQKFVEISTNEYFNYTTYASEKWGSSAGQRMSPRYPATGIERFRDCSSFVWDVLDRIGFNLNITYAWTTYSAYLVLKEYQVLASERKPGDIIIYWKTAGAPVGGYAEHMMFHIGNGWHIDVTGGKLTACQQRNNYNYDSGFCRFFRIPPSMYPV